MENPACKNKLCLAGSLSPTDRVYLERDILRALSFYKQFKDSLKLLQQNHPEIYAAYNHWKQNNPARQNNKNAYRNWLLDYAFHDFVNFDTATQKKLREGDPE